MYIESTDIRVIIEKIDFPFKVPIKAGSKRLEVYFHRKDYYEWFLTYFYGYESVFIDHCKLSPSTCLFIIDQEIVDYKSLENTNLAKLPLNDKELNGHLWIHSGMQGYRLYYITHGDQAMRKYEPVRLVRDYIIDTFLKEGCLYLHAAAVTRGTNAILLVGNKFAGKTTSLLNLLDSKFNYLSNDKVLFCPKTNTVSSVPFSIGVRSKTIKIIPELNALTDIKTANFLHYQVTSSNKNLYPQKLFLLPAELCELFDTKIAPIAKLILVISPVYNPNAKTIDIRPLTDNERLSMINAMIIHGSIDMFPQAGFLACFRIEYNEFLAEDFRKTVEELYVEHSRDV